MTDHLLAAVVDGVHVGNWQRAGDPKAPRPKRIPRPGVVDADVRIGGGKNTIADVERILASVRDS